MDDTTFNAKLKQIEDIMLQYGEQNMVFFSMQDWSDIRQTLKANADQQINQIQAESGMHIPVNAPSNT